MTPPARVGWFHLKPFVCSQNQTTNKYEPPCSHRIRQKMHYQSAFLIPVLATLLFLPLVESFSVDPCGLGVRRSPCWKTDSRQRSTFMPLRSSTPYEGATLVGSNTKDKLTKEAHELLAVLDARNKSSPAQNHTHSLVVAPSVRVSISEEFGREPGAFTPGQLVASLKALGFDLVLDTNTAADLTVIEEGTELLQRLRSKRSLQSSNERPFPSPLSGEMQERPLPLFTSCCPGWMGLVEKSEPELAAYISTCKSPHMMYGAVIKEYSQPLFGVPADRVYLTSVMPCVRKRGESDRPAFVHNGVRDVDNVITTKDLGMLLRLKGIDPSQLAPQVFDSPFQTDGTGSGAGQLFGATGGVMEAAVRSVYEIVTGQTLPRLELEEVRGLDGVKEAIIPLYNESAEGTGTDDLIDLRVAVCSGLGNAKQLVKKMKSGEVSYDFVEVMACPGGCINGGGQPVSKPDVVEKRLKTVYNLDRSLPIRKSHENPTVKTMYERLIGEAGGDTAHRLLHVEPVYRENRVEEEDLQQ